MSKLNPKNRSERIESIYNMGKELKLNLTTLIFVLVFLNDRELKKFYLDMKKKFESNEKNT